MRLGTPCLTNSVTFVLNAVGNRALRDLLYFNAKNAEGRNAKSAKSFATFALKRSMGCKNCSHVVRSQPLATLSLPREAAPVLKNADRGDAKKAQIRRIAKSAFAPLYKGVGASFGKRVCAK